QAVALEEVGGGPGSEGLHHHPSAPRRALLALLIRLRAGLAGLLVAMLRVSERRLDHERLREGNGKRALHRAIERVG
ncbi:MAG: hypothetical protein ACERNK_18860, partial [Deltaproteobacteria bacterium]